MCKDKPHALLSNKVTSQWNAVLHVILIGRRKGQYP